MGYVADKNRKVDELKLLEFVVGAPEEERIFGINVAKTLEVIARPEKFSTYPNSHPAVTGMARVRGEEFPIVDLARWMGADVEDSLKSRVILAELNSVRLGFLVTDVRRISVISWDMVEPPSKLVRDADFQYVIGSVEMDGVNIMLLDFERIISQINPSTGFAGKGAGLSRANRSAASVFVAEDSPFIRKQMINILAGAGYRVFSASDGKEALERLKWAANEAEDRNMDIHRYLNVIVTDIEMPQMDGATLITMIREIRALEDIPIVIFSSMADESNKRKWAPLGAADCVTKPEIGRLVEKIDNLVFGADGPKA